ncbi:hypothetical protein QZM22_20790 [Burkholderia oklahomensis]|uniref:hypothetical protein n=1 Tax=Burkholderia oklahomensis TaxID=342113 RepID=UPI00265399CC|nr:hypothetical protein [Burkholderia oklahomensis]MDN7674892.1 hypothetical protein [Burkholderia oklahomensis]
MRVVTHASLRPKRRSAPRRQSSRQSRAGRRVGESNRRIPPKSRRHGGLDPTAATATATAVAGDATGMVDMDDMTT